MSKLNLYELVMCLNLIFSISLWIFICRRVFFYEYYPENMPTLILSDGNITRDKQCDRDLIVASVNIKPR